jgi:hypothetical protein
MTTSRALKIIRASAIYDLVVTVAFALPITAKWVFEGLAVLHSELTLTGSTPDPANAYTVMFANLMGGLVTVWALYRILRPSLAAGVADVGGRVFFSIGMAGALVAGASPIVLVMLVLEVLWAIVQSAAVVGAVRRRAWTERAPEPVRL